MLFKGKSISLSLSLKKKNILKQNLYAIVPVSKFAYGDLLIDKNTGTKNHSNTFFLFEIRKD